MFPAWGVVVFVPPRLHGPGIKMNAFFLRGVGTRFSARAAARRLPEDDPSQFVFGIALIGGLIAAGATEKSLFWIHNNVAQHFHWSSLVEKRQARFISVRTTGAQRTRALISIHVRPPLRPPLLLVWFRSVVSALFQS